MMLNFWSEIEILDSSNPHGSTKSRLNGVWMGSTETWRPEFRCVTCLTNISMLTNLRCRADHNVGTWTVGVCFFSAILAYCIMWRGWCLETMTWSYLQDVLSDQCFGFGFWDRNWERIGINLTLILPFEPAPNGLPTCPICPWQHRICHPVCVKVKDVTWADIEEYSFTISTNIQTSSIHISDIASSKRRSIVWSISPLVMQISRTGQSCCPSYSCIHSAKKA